MNLGRFTGAATALLRKREGETQTEVEYARTLGPQPVPSPAVRVLAVLPSGRDADTLDDILRRMGWELHRAHDCFQAHSALERASMPLVLYDRDVPGPSWGQALKMLRTARHPACLILTSRVSDGLLWEEVILKGGFDVLTRPFDEIQVTRTLRFALSHWKSGWMRRDWDHFVWK